LELKEFVKTTIIAICDGIAEAKEETNNKYGNCVVAPGRINGNQVGNKLEERYNIDFEVGVTLEETKTKNGSISAKLKIINFDKNHINKNNETRINRITFSVPYLPQGFYVSNKNNKQQSN
jgi:hypothetical protein